jgi:double-stranded uracil-DNA glycosylase
MRKTGLPPIADAGTRLFVLGSLPGDKSLADGRYYAHPTNQFWRIIGALIGEELHGRPYDERLAALSKAGVGLWDVVSAATREGSQDSAIRDASHNAIHRLRNDYPRLEAIAFNGGRAAQDGRKLLADHGGLMLYDLVSSSGLAGVPLAAKVERWNVIRAHLK